MKYIFLLLFLLIIISCGYPDIDSVPNFNDIYLTDEELVDYCSNTNPDKKNIDNCINNYKSKN